MPLSAGTRLGQYEIISPLGAGGMGEVYRARDTKLGRGVAIKVLPEAVATRPDRIARFEREAKVLASLNHPHIAALFGMEESAGRHFLVMELVEGETLAERIASPSASGRGHLRVDDALKVALQIAAALEAAHECGIIHRDLKPANIKITPDEVVKVLDFGLAKAAEGDRASQDLSQSPTVSFGGTREGTILGTAAYMSPEQARGKPVDKRTDIWAFGCVLYEMLTGRLAFSGETVSDAVTAILSREPDWLALPAETPESVRRLLRRSLEKDPKRRVHHIADARIELEETLAQPSASGHLMSTDLSAPIVTNGARAKARVRLAWIAATLSVAAIIAALALGRVGFVDRSAVDARVYRSSIALPEGMQIPADRSSANLGPAGRFALSPDGRRLAFVARRGATGLPMLWVRPLDAVVAQSLAGTEGAAYPFWSPDSRFVAFLARGKLKKIDVAGGAPLTLCDAALGATGAWNRDDVILFTPKGGSPLYRVSASGGTSSPVTTFDATSGDAQHWFPFFLPDGRHFLYSALGSKKAGATDPRGVYVGSLDPNESSTLLVQDGSHAKYAEGHLIFLRGTTLMARPFDANRRELHGEAEPLAEQLQTTNGNVTGAAGAFTVSETGVLAYQTGSGVVRSQLVWFDRAGKQIGLLGDQADYADLELSPDGQRLAVSVFDPAEGTRDLWLYDVKRELRTRFTFDSANEFEPIWSPDGDRLVFARIKASVDLFQKPSSGGREDALLEGGLGKFPSDWSPNGRFILYIAGGAAIARSDLLVLPLVGDKKPFPFLETSFIETRGRFSPDGRWIAYASDESGQLEIYVARFPEPGERRRISTAGGVWPRWRRDGREIIYLAPDNTLTAATVNGEGASFEAGAARPLFAVRPRPQVTLGDYPYDVSADGQRFLVNTLVEETASSAITLVVNWAGGLKK
jgi:eukaryotic-like serine/threonine-protein kinase